MRLLLCLAEHAGEVVSIDDLLDQVWSDVIVAPDSVYQAVTSLRRLLGDDPKQPTYIATVPRLVGECFSMLSNIKMVPPPFETPIIEVKQFWHRRYHSDPRSMWFRGLLMSIFRNAEFKGPVLTPSQRDLQMKAVRKDP